MSEPMRTLPDQTLRRRAWAAAALLCTVCVGLAVRLCQLQLLSGDFYTCLLYTSDAADE